VAAGALVAAAAAGVGAAEGEGGAAMKAWEILVGDCRALLATLPAESVQTCVTSPPYFGLRDYGHEGQIGLEPTPEEYVAEMVGVFREVRRVLRGDGTLWLNLGDSYNAYNGNRGASTSFQSASEEALPALPSGHGLTVKCLKPKDLIGIPWRVAFALQSDGWYLRSDIIWAKPNPMPESVTDRPTKAHEYVFLLSKSERYFWDADAVREANQGDGRARGGFGGKQAGQNGNATYSGKVWDDNPLGRNRRTVWTIATEPCRAAHFAVMPTKLVEPCILAGSRLGDLVLDPFAGAGTVGLVATRLQRRFVGCELNPEYARIARERITGDAPLFNAGGGL
jgi:DNA modification methylase